MTVRITKIHAEAYSVPVDMPVGDTCIHASFVLTRMLTDEGIEGHGMCIGLDLAGPITLYINNVVGPALVGESPLNNERIWTRLLREQNHWYGSGFWSSVASAIDIAVWDVKGRALGCSVAELLGGARDQVPTYVTFGASELSQDELVETAKLLVADGHKGLKMVVGGIKHSSATRAGLQQFEGDRRTRIIEDAQRVSAVREAVGDDIALMIDGNCAFDLNEATELCRQVEGLGIAYFEEPVRANDARLMRELRRRTSIPIAAGQFEGHLHEHRRLIELEAVDIVQPNVAHTGGYTAAAKVSALAHAYHLPLSNGGAFPHHNAHLHAGVPNGGGVEYHWSWWKAGEMIFDAPPSCAGGSASVKGPGLGFSVRPPADLEEFRVR